MINYFDESKNHSNELSSSERKHEYYLNIQLGKDVRTQTDVIKKQTKLYLENQLRQADSIIISQKKAAELINSGFRELSEQVNQNTEAFYDLGIAFEWGISEVVWQIEQNRDVLKTIAEGIWAPLDATAVNWKRKAESCYALGFINDAEEFYLNSDDIMRLDFTVHMSLGYIYMRKEKLDKEKAIFYFERAAEYAKPQSIDHASMALLSAAEIYFSLGKLDKAIERSEEAIKLTPNLARAYYQNAQYHAQSGLTEKSLKSLDKAIDFSVFYVAKLNRDPLFNHLRYELTVFIEELRIKEKQKFEDCIRVLEESFKKYSPFIAEYAEYCKIKQGDKSLFAGLTKQINDKISDAKNKAKEDGLIDYRILNDDTVPILAKKVNYYYYKLENSLLESLKECHGKIESEKQIHKSRSSNYLDHSLGALKYGSFIVPIVASLIFYSGFAKLWMLVFMIPVVSQILSLVMIYNLIFNTEKLRSGDLLAQGDLQVAWLIVIFIIIVGLIYLLKRLNSKDDTESEVEYYNKEIDHIQSIRTKLKDASTEWFSMPKDIEPKLGAIYKSEVVVVDTHHAYCEFLPGKFGKLNRNEIDWEKYETMEDTNIRVGDIIQLKLTEISYNGKEFALSRRALLHRPE